MAMSENDAQAGMTLKEIRDLSEQEKRIDLYLAQREQALKQAKLQDRQASTEFTKVAIAVAIASSVITGAIVQILNMLAAK